MIRECFRTNTGIQFYSESLKRVGLKPDTLLDLCPPAPTPPTARVAQVEAAAHAAGSSDNTLVDPTEESEELKDVCSPIHDELKRRKAWWIVEFLPTRFRQQILRDGRYIWKHFWKYVFVYSTVLSHSHGHGSPVA